MKQKDNKPESPVLEIDTELSAFQEQVSVEPEIIETDITPKKKRGRPKKDRFDNEENQNFISNSIITGTILLLLIDVVIPTIIVLVNNKVSKKKIKAVNLKLTQAQKSELQPLADEAAKKIMLEGSPVTMLIIGLIGIYTTNLLMLKAE